jgi:hypothetical protein
MKKRYRILIWIVLAMVLAAALTVWLARDWPRRQVQSALARALDADVDLGRLELHDRRTFILHDLHLRRAHSYPWLESLEVERLIVTGSLGDILDNRFEELVLEGVVAVVRGSEEPPPDREEPAGVEVGRLGISGGRLVVLGGEGESRFEVSGEVTGLGQGLGGEVRLRAGQLALVPLLSFLAGAEAVAGFVEDTPLDLHRPVADVEIDVRFDPPDAAATLQARAGGEIGFRDPDRQPLAFPGFSLRLLEGSDGAWLYTVDAVAPGLGTLVIEGGMAADGQDQRIEKVAVETGDPVRLLYTLGLAPEGVAGKGRAELTLERAPAGGAPLCRLEARAEALTLLRGGQNRPDGDKWQLDSLCPLDLTYQGTLEQVTESGDWLTAGRALLTSASAGDLHADGSLMLGGASENRLAAEWNWTGPSIPDLRRLAATGFGFNISKRYRLDGLPRAAGRISGTLDEPLVEGTVDVDGVDFCLESARGQACPLTLNGGTLAADFRFEERNNLRFPGVRLGGDLQPKPLSVLPLILSGSGWIDPVSLQGRFGIETATWGDLVTISGDGRWNPDEEPQVTAALRLDQADLPAIRRALVPLTGELLPGYELEATLSGRGDAAYSEKDGWTAAGTMEMGEAWFASEDGARAVQGLASSWQVQAEAGADSSLRVEASTTAGGFQLLWDSLFGDFGELEPQVSLAAGLEGEGDRAGHWWAEGDLQPVPGLRLRASFSGSEEPDRRFSASLGVDDLASAYESCVRRPLGDSLPLLVRLDAGGRINVFAEGHLDGEGAALQGRVRLDGLDLTGEERTMAVRGLDLELPLDLVWGPPGEDGVRPVDGAARHGRMGFDELKLDAVTVQRTDSDLVVQGDTVSLEASQSLPLLGGTVTFQRLTLVGLLGGSRYLETGMTLEGLQLGELSRAMDWPLFEGELDGHLPRVELSPTRLRVDGGGEMALFGGKVIISDISGEEVLSRYPRLSFSAEFSEIDLVQVTRTFDFGAISGILEGRVSDCRLFAGTPVGFRAEMRTVPRKGVAQTINVKAINNIAIVGTGGRITVFDRGLHSLLDRYTYEQLGVKMRLEKDMFYLRGTESRGAKELFLKGRLPFRIDVVNAEPGKTVSFSTMLARFQSIDFSESVTSTGGGGRER